MISGEVGRDGVRRPTAVSTVKILDLNSQSGNSQSNTVFDINNPALTYPNGGQAYYTNVIRPQLAANGWSTADLGRIDCLVGGSCSTTGGYRVIAALKGNTAVNLWSGTGYYQVTPDGTAIGSIITGGLSGGLPATYETVSQVADYTVSSTAVSSLSDLTTISGVSAGGSSSILGAALDPVNRVTGDFLYSHDDLTVGSGTFPYGLGFQRSYDSGRRLVGGPLGLGWTHNFAITAKSDSDGFDGMGANSPVSAASAIAGLYVMQDILNLSDGTKPLDRILVATEIAKWVMDQLTGNVVAVARPENTEHFVRLADGSYNPPLGSAASLSLSGTYTYKSADQTNYAFNSDGTLGSVTFAAGPVVSLAYSGGNLTSVTNGMGRTLTLSYSGSILTGVADGTGRSVSYSYDSNGNLTSFKDALGQTSTFAYDIPGRMTQYFLPAFPSTAQVSNTYDSLGRVELQQDANGNTSSLFFAGPRSEIDDPAGTAHVMYFSPRGKLTTDIDGLGHQTVNAYDGQDRLLSTAAPEGNSIAYTYDANSNPLTVTRTAKPGSNLAPTRQTFTYDCSSFNKVCTATDALGQVTTNSWSATTGTLTSVTSPAVAAGTPVQAYTYDSRGQVLTATDPSGKVTRYGYDSATEALTSVVEDYGRLALTTGYGYDAVGNQTSVTDPNGNVTTRQYDALRRLTREAAPTSIGTVTSYAYDGNGNLEGTTTNYQIFASIWSPSGKKLRDTNRWNEDTIYTYDVLDRLATVTDAQGRVTRYAYDVLGHLVSISNTAIQAAPLVQYGYTANGRRYSLTDANGHQTLSAYDGFDRPASTTYPDGSVESFGGYDANDNLLSRTTRSGNTVGFSYDALNRLSTKAPTGQSTISYGYDLAGRLTTIADSTGSFTLGYDTAGRRTSELRPDGKQVSNQFDAAGNRTRLTWPDGYYVTYGYDAANRLVTALENGTTHLAIYGYDLIGRRASLAYGNGTSSSYSYAVNNTLSTLTHNFVGSSLSLGYGYNKVHQRTSLSLSDTNFLSRPTAPVNAAYTTNSLNQYTAVGGQALSYDGNGNLANDGTLTYGYNTEKQLLTASGGGHTYTYAYDPFGRRAQKTVDGTVTAFLSDGRSEIADYDGSGGLLRRYVPGPGTDQQIVTINVSGGNAKLYNHQDGLGSVIALSTGTGTVSDKYGYDLYGNTATPSGNAFRFTGRRLDVETGLYDYRARMYSPVLGRFVQTDPIGDRGGVNLYAYVGNDPLNRVDPTGLYANQVDSSGYALIAQPVVEGISNLASNVASDPLGTATSVLNSFPQLGMGAGVAGLGMRSVAGLGEAAVGAAEGAGDVAANIANGPRLAGQLSLESANSPFTATGELTQDALNSSRQIIAPSELGNPALPQGVGKFATPTFQSPSGDFQVHFYMNSTTMEPYYGLDYKAIFNASKPFGGP